MRYVISLMMLLLLAGCSNAPGKATIRAQIVDSLYRDGRSAIFTLKNFRLVNGYEKGPATYVADIEYDLQFRKGLAEIAREFEQQTKTNPFGSLGAGFSLLSLKIQYGDFRPGEQIHQAESVTLVKTGNGWLLKEK